MSLLKGFGEGVKGFFFEENPEKETTKKADSNAPTLPNFNTQTQPTANVVTPTIQFPNIGNMNNSVISPQIQQEDVNKFTEHFEQLINNSNFPGPDYFEFSRMVDAMGVSVPIENRMTVNFVGLKAADPTLTKEKLISTANEYIKILENDELNFKNNVDGAILGEVKSKRSAIEANAQKILSLQEKIKQSNDEILTLQNDISVLNNEASQLELKANTKLNTYTMVLQNYKNRILENIQNIQKYLS